MSQSTTRNHVPTFGPLYIGAGGYAYPEWRQTGFYPPDIQSARMLSFYAQRFPITELNSTWYQMPQPEAMERLLGQTPEGFLFAAKLHRSLSHEPEPEHISSLTAAFRYGLAPLIQARRLAAVLLQFPEAFDRTLTHRRWLTSLLGHLAGLPLAVEFRHCSWATDKVFAEMEKRQVAVVTPDTPDLPELFPATTVVTHRHFFYVRFHGRNRGQWRKKGESRFDYDYTRAELQEWIEKHLATMSGLTRRGFLFFNNHKFGQSTKNATDMAYLIDQYGFELGKI